MENKGDQEEILEDLVGGKRVEEIVDPDLAQYTLELPKEPLNPQARDRIGEKLKKLTGDKS